MSSELSFRAWWSLENAVNEFFERGELRKMVIFSSPVMELSGFFWNMQNSSCKLKLRAWWTLAERWIILNQEIVHASWNYERGEIEWNASKVDAERTYWKLVIMNLTENEWINSRNLVDSIQMNDSKLKSREKWIYLCFAEKMLNHYELTQLNSMQNTSAEIGYKWTMLLNLERTYWIIESWCKLKDGYELTQFKWTK